MPFREIFQLTRPIHRLTWPARYVLATLIVLAFAAIQWLLKDFIGFAPFLLFFPPVIFNALIINHGAGIYSSVLSALLAHYLVVPSTFSWSVARPGYLLAEALFLAILLLIAWLIEALRRATLSLVQAEREKSHLLDELNHRVKNSLQILGSVLNLQAATVASPAERAILETAIHRIGVIGRLHGRLSVTSEATLVDMRSFLQDLCDDLGLSLIGAQSIVIRVEVAPVHLDSSRAATVGMIVNELVTNAFKHAFPDGRTGIVDVTLNHGEPGRLVLAVVDNGVGSGTGKPVGMGGRLVPLLVEQIGGTLHTAADGGTTVRVEFPTGVPGR